MLHPNNFFDEQLGGPITGRLFKLDMGSNLATFYKSFMNSRIHSGVDAELNGVLYFGISDFFSDVVNTSYGNSYLYRTDGTSDGTYKVKTLSSDGSKFIKDMAVADNKVFFTTYTNGAI